MSNESTVIKCRSQLNQIIKNVEPLTVNAEMGELRAMVIRLLRIIDGKLYDNQ